MEKDKRRWNCFESTPHEELKVDNNDNRLNTYLVSQVMASEQTENESIHTDDRKSPDVSRTSRSPNENEQVSESSNPLHG